MLTSYSRTDGKKLREIGFSGTVISDGMAAANGRLYLCTQDGKVLCFGEKK